MKLFSMCFIVLILISCHQSDQVSSPDKNSVQSESHTTEIINNTIVVNGDTVFSKNNIDTVIHTKNGTAIITTQGNGNEIIIDIE